MSIFLYEVNINTDTRQASASLIDPEFFPEGGGGGGPERYLSLRGIPRHTSVIDTHIST